MNFGIDNNGHIEVNMNRYNYISKPDSVNYFPNNVSRASLTLPAR